LGAQAAQIGAGAGLGITLRPDRLAGARFMQMLRLLLGGAVFDEDRADMGETLVRQIGRADAGQFFDQDHLLYRRCVDAAMFLRPMRRGPALLAQGPEPWLQLLR